MTLALRSFLETPSAARNGCLALVIGLVLAHVAPFDTGSLPMLVRYGYWIGLTLLNWFMVGVILLAIGDRQHQVPPIVLAVLASLLAAVPLMFAVVWLETYLRTLPAPPPMLLLGVYRDVAVLAVAIAIPAQMVRGFALTSMRGTPDTAEPRMAEPARNAVDGGALPVALGDRLLALSAEDHYLRVHTEQGSSLILRRLADAVAELPVDSGRQVHRSHWVAQAAVRRVERDGPRMVLVLTNGLRIPVSRTYRLAVQESGWPQADRPPDDNPSTALG